jgi:CheY-like chemotaxis protein
MTAYEQARHADIQHAFIMAAIDTVTQKFYDLAIMDIRMPELGGIDALKKIKMISPGRPLLST